jgi:hypothetical protein
MERKRSKGVTFWGWAFIILSIIGLLGAIRPRSESYIYGIGLQLFSVISSVAYLICGIFILKLNEIARKAAIILGIISIISIPFYLAPLTKKAISEDTYISQKKIIVEQIKPEHQQKALEDLARNREMANKIVPIVIIILSGIPALIFELIPIIFFTRAKVKEQFKELTENV